jgi:hypothetical protein
LAKSKLEGTPLAGTLGGGSEKGGGASVGTSEAKGCGGRDGASGRLLSCGSGGMTTTAGELPGSLDLRGTRLAKGKRGSTTGGGTGMPINVLITRGTALGSGMTTAS